MCMSAQRPRNAAAGACVSSMVFGDLSGKLVWSLLVWSLTRRDTRWILELHGLLVDRCMIRWWPRSLANGTQFGHVNEVFFKLLEIRKKCELILFWRCEMRSFNYHVSSLKIFRFEK